MFELIFSTKNMLRLITMKNLHLLYGSLLFLRPSMTADSFIWDQADTIRVHYVCNFHKCFTAINCKQADYIAKQMCIKKCTINFRKKKLGFFYLVSHTFFSQTICLKKEVKKHAYYSPKQLWLCVNSLNSSDSSIQSTCTIIDLRKTLRLFEIPIQICI